MSYFVSLALVLTAAGPSAAAPPSGAPVQVAWQRTLADAEALSRATGKPLLVCVNMDGEMACERFAGTKYKTPSFVELTDSFIPVIASPQRHSKVDHDGSGQRVECPRFGRVTCGEHMRIEEPVFRRFFDGKRYAPRHVGVSFLAGDQGDQGDQGEVLFDRYLDSDLRAVDRALRSHGKTEGRSADLPAAVAERDATYRAQVEAGYKEADPAERAKMVEATLRAEVPQAELLRLALHEETPELRQLAANALAKIEGLRDIELVLLALAQESDPGRRQNLVAALKDRAPDDPRTMREIKVSNVLRADSLLDHARWTMAFEGDDNPVALDDRAYLEAEMADLLRDASRLGKDAVRSLQIAQGYLGLARWGLAEGGGPGYFLQDAESNAQDARRLGADEARVDAVRAQIAWLDFRQDEAGSLARSAVRQLDPQKRRREAFATLSVLAAARTRSILAANAGEWNEAWASEALSAYPILESHPGSTAAQWASHIDLLNALNLKAERDRLLSRGLERFPVASELHERLRSRIIERRGIAGLEDDYKERRASAADPAGHDWFTGYATLVMAEDHRRGKRWDEAQRAYERAKGHFASSAGGNPEYEASCTHFQAMALAGQAQAALKDKQLETAVVRISDAVSLRPESIESPDGLQRTPLDILRDIARAVRGPSRTDLRARLARLERIAPEVWHKVN